MAKEYACSCGFRQTVNAPDSIKIFTNHLRQMSRKEKGLHRSIGQIESLTGEVVMPPAEQRTAKQRQQASRDATVKTALRNTNLLAEAQQVNFVPKIYTCTYTPIMRAGQVASQREWGWREGMSLENFLDTVIYYFFAEHGIKLNAYVVMGRPDENGDGNHDVDDDGQIGEEIDQELLEEQESLT